jgi:hypothetical protein
MFEDKIMFGKKWVGKEMGRRRNRNGLGKKRRGRNDLEKNVPERTDYDRVHLKSNIFFRFWNQGASMSMKLFLN